MDSLHRKSRHMKNEHAKSTISDAANELLTEGKKIANDLYEEGLTHLNKTEKQVKEYSDQIIGKIQEKPLTSILIAGGIGFLLSKLLRK